MTVLICPDCGESEIDWEAGFLTGSKYHCRKCHYRGTFILERKVVVKEDETVREL